MLKIQRAIFIFLFIFSPMAVSISYGQAEDTLSILLSKAEARNQPYEQQNAHVDTLIEVATKHKNNKYLCHGYLRKIILAYNTYNFTECRRWAELLEPLALKEKEYDIYFSGKQCLIDMILVGGELEKGEEEAREMLKKAQSEDHKTGIVLSHLCLYHAYYMSYREKLAVEELEKAYLVSSQTDPMGVNIEILRALISSYGNLSDYPNQLKYLKIKESILLDHIKKHPEEKESTSSTINLTYTLFVNYYISIENPQMAGEYLERSKQYFSENLSKIHKAFYYKGCLEYYEFTEDYKNALWCIDSLLNYALMDYDRYAFITYKARILWKNGLAKDAANLYEKSMLQRDSLYASRLDEQVEQMGDTENKDKILLKKEQIQNYINTFLLISVIAGLLMLIAYIIHTVRAKNSLQKDEHRMRVMNNRMHSANAAKDKFLSNISQSISTPLETIVNNSKELASENEMSLERKEELSQSVLKTSETLMVLINNILDLSRLESGMMKFHSEDISPISHIRLFLNSSSERNATISCAIPEEEIEKYNMIIDSGKFSQVLDTIITRKKELSVSISSTSSSISITVTGSDLASSEISQDIIIKNEINLLIVRHFKGEYSVDPEQSSITIALPVSYLP